MLRSNLPATWTHFGARRLREKQTVLRKIHSDGQEELATKPLDRGINHALSHGKLDLCFSAASGENAPARPCTAAFIWPSETRQRTLVRQPSSSATKRASQITGAVVRPLEKCKCCGQICQQHELISELVDFEKNKPSCGKSTRTDRKNSQRNHSIEV